MENFVDQHYSKHKAATISLATTILIWKLKDKNNKNRKLEFS